MSAIKNYFSEESKLQMLVLGHPKPSDFYLSVWQKTRSAVPLLLWRVFLFLGCLGLVFVSFYIYIVKAWQLRFWFIYLTHWGITLNTLTTGFAVGVSTRYYIYGPISNDAMLPWYVKIYWVLYNIAIPLAFLITIFFWTLIYNSADGEDELSFGVDIAVHGLNTVLMFGLLMSSSQPSRMLHIYQPLLFAVIYIVFGAIYFVAGGTDAAGHKWIYSLVDWSRPASTMGVLALTGLGLMALHFLVMGLAVARDVLASKLFHDSVTVYVEEGVPLQQRPSAI